MKSETENIRVRLEAALAGRLIEQPIYAAYDWFVENRPLDWEGLFEQGLGQVNHANLIRHHHPHLEIKEVVSGRVVSGVRMFIGLPIKGS